MSTLAKFLQVNPLVFEILEKYTFLTDYYLRYSYFNESKYQKFKKFERNKPDKFSIIKKGTEAEYILDINKTWYFFHYLFTGYDTSTIPNKVIGLNKHDKKPSINAILGGQIFLYDNCDYIRYLTASEVNQIANALSKLKLADVVQRLQDKDCYHDYIFDCLS
ncbi:hypothetical protein NIES267_49910 [Calothrix parasitica NIES-267]|uniref:Uncharacterized protein n=1 Tax=Calothrix parasitica NIES-267 TaxID=1973488 RepID=A0A1Z4LWH8_9CYAN|nr:hypothetical protein NIES267_49910 [Calothrix parasitica NIES-267]